MCGAICCFCRVCSPYFAVWVLTVCAGFDGSSVTQCDSNRIGQKGGCSGCGWHVLVHPASVSTLRTERQKEYFCAGIASNIHMSVFMCYSFLSVRPIYCETLIAPEANRGTERQTVHQTCCFAAFGISAVLQGLVVSEQIQRRQSLEQKLRVRYSACEHTE